MGETRKWRLFIGNLAESVKQDELKEKFEQLLKASTNKWNQEDVRVGNVEIRVKNEDNYFGYVDIHGSGVGNGGTSPPPLQLHKVIDLMNNTKWKGSLIKVQLAKESFLDKLKRERAGLPPSSNVGGVEKNDNSHPPPPRFERKFPGPKKPDNFDFEIVSNSAVATRKTFPGEVNPEEKQDEDADSDDADDFHEGAGIPKFKGLGAFGFGQPNNNRQQDDNVITPLEFSRPVVQQKQKQDPPPPLSEEDKSRFERFQRIAGYPVPRTDNVIARPESNRLKSFNSSRKYDDQIKGTSPTTAISTSADPPPSKGVVFRKHKQQNSDFLRQQSLHKMEEIKTQQLNIIKSSLSQSNISNNFESAVAESVNSGRSKKTPKMDIFGGDQGEEDDVGEFQLKKQYEGAEGQKLLELRGKWGFDERFNVDERFKGEEQDDVLAGDEEKQKQMNILSDVLGSSVTLQAQQPFINKKEQNKHNSVLIHRYDPDVDPDQEMQEDLKSKPKSIDNAKIKPNKKSETPVPEPLIRSSEPATYKTVSNLKSLFSSEAHTSTMTDNHKKDGFSLLATFGGEDDRSTLDQVDTISSGAPRQFWESNPFKYDSSDDEDDTDGVRNKSSKKPALPTIPIPKSSPTSFFFRKNDSRFAGVEDYFLKRDVMEGRIDYDEKRKELRSIVKAKARNAKRKDEKRTLAIKRAIRKKRKYRKTLIKSGSSNAMKLGGSA